MISDLLSLRSDDGLKKKSQCAGGDENVKFETFYVLKQKHELVISLALISQQPITSCCLFKS